MIDPTGSQQQSAKSCEAVLVLSTPGQRTACKLMPVSLCHVEEGFSRGIKVVVVLFLMTIHGVCGAFIKWSTLKTNV